MSSDSELQSIVSLQETLDELGQARTRLDSIPDWMKDLHDEHSGRKAEIDEVAGQKEQAEKEQRRAEAAASDAEEKLKHYQEQISRVSTQREYGALLKEIDTVKDLISESEKQAIEAIETVDESKSSLSDLEEKFRDLDERYKSELSKWEAEKPYVAARAAELESRAEELRGKVHRRYLSLFERIWERNGQQAVARIAVLQAKKGGNVMWHCEACNYNVRPQVVVQIRAGAISQCESCKRILYWLDDETEEDDDV